MRKTLIIAGVAMLLLLTACGTISPEHAATIEGGLRQMLSEGAISQAQFDALMEALYSKTGPDWTAIGTALASTAAAFLGIPIIVRKQRGPVGISRDALEAEIEKLRNPTA